MICLNMIVKDASGTIEQCLDSVRQIANRWVIVDTGSMDGTQEKVKSLLADIPGQLCERPWVNFEHNRNDTLELAKADLHPDDFILFMDADDVLVGTSGSGAGLPPLGPAVDCYEIEEHDGSLRFWRPMIVRAGLPWRWIGATHEYLSRPESSTSTRIEGMYRQRGKKTAEQMNAKLQRDLWLLLEAVKSNPKDERSIFYLAQTLKDLGRWKEALVNYERRAEMAGWEEEGWWAQYEAAMLRERLDELPASVICSYMAVYERRPTRAEALYQLARYCRLRGMQQAAFMFAEKACCVPLPDDRLFVDVEVYRWKALDEFSIAAYWVGRYVESKRSCDDLLNGLAPEGERERIIKNLSFTEAVYGR
jgi:glycosyltransferase involved in cell wall biosynthesis